MIRVRGIAAVILLGGLLVGLPMVRYQVLGAPLSQAATPPQTLSPYWESRIQRWESLIVQEAGRRGLDPDFVASLIWRESRGDPKAIGPAGAVGLMQIMPKESGFSWRPSREELIDPFTNVYWGARTLSTVIRQGRGDVFSALAAYNGGWDKVDDRGPRAFASTILRDYVRAVALRSNIEGHWVAFFAIADEGLRGPIWVVDSAREDVYFYSDANVTAEGAPLIPPVTPVALVAKCEDGEQSNAFSVGVWIYDADSQDWLSGDVPVSLGSAGVHPDLMHAADRAAAVSPAVMAGSVRPAPVETPAPAVLVEVVPTPDGSAATLVTPDSAPGEVAAAAVVTETPVAVEPPGRGAPPEATAAEAAVAELVVAEALTGTRTCAGGPLKVDTYPLDRINTPQGWMVRIYAQASGGNCLYTYAWNDESGVQGVDIDGPIVFEITSTRRDSALLGTVVVTSGDETVRAKLYIRPPE